ncbi:hypothetical protein ANCCAN_05624 [Ancylostoma caninum]|uniref:SXP/RAL-2 family protein Ani s 5-like cation-binding domain-containing protein n=1 Tax=Ancylostoma caninum TaxID=29170 RepID=A0A368GZ90_ANCCA|nr:hypothetical protein ANCCAN_05624 [Ancylostoma caninum]
MRQLLILMMFAPYLHMFTLQQGSMFLPPLPFLQNATYEARMEFYTITQNTTLTQRQMNAAMQEWASKYNLTKSLNNYLNTTEEETNKAQKELDTVLTQLPSFFKQLRLIENNLDLTWAQASEQVVKLFDSVDSREAQAAFFLMVLYSPGITATSISVGVGPCYGGMCGSTTYGNEGGLNTRTLLGSVDNANDGNMSPENNFDGPNSGAPYSAYGSRQMFSLNNGDMTDRNRPWSRVSAIGNPWSRAASMQGDAFPLGSNMGNGIGNRIGYGQQ